MLTCRHRILKRRLAWLIGQWVSAEEECVKIPLMWQILLHLLEERSESSDMAVRLSAAVTLKECVDVSRSQVWADDSFGSSTYHTSYHILRRPFTSSECHFPLPEIADMQSEAPRRGKHLVGEAICQRCPRGGDRASWR